MSRKLSPLSAKKLNDLITLDARETMMDKQFYNNQTEVRNAGLIISWCFSDFHMSYLTLESHYKTGYFKRLGQN